MKKIKVVLTATALVALVGGAFALNAHRSNPSIFRCVSNVCKLQELGFTDEGQGTFTIPDNTYFKDGVNNAACTDCTNPITKSTVVFIED